MKPYEKGEGLHHNDIVKHYERDEKLRTVIATVLERWCWKVVKFETQQKRLRIEADNLRWCMAYEAQHSAA